jgi:hypothetical protein
LTADAVELVGKIFYANRRPSSALALPLLAPVKIPNWPARFTSVTKTPHVQQPPQEHQGSCEYGKGLGKTWKRLWDSMGDFRRFGNDKPLKTLNFGAP